MEEFHLLTAHSLRYKPREVVVNHLIDTIIYKMKINLKLEVSFFNPQSRIAKRRHQNGKWLSREHSIRYGC